MTAAVLRDRARAALASQTQVLKQNLKTPIPAPRIALERKISLRFPHFQGFLTETSSNISITGMFVRAHFPQRPGTILDFEFHLHDGLKLIRGTGEVVWVRRKDEGDLPAGMGIRFLRLDPESRRLIRWAVEKQIDDGIEPFDLDVHHGRPPGDGADAVPPSPSPGPPSSGDAHRTHPYAGYAVARRPPPPKWLPAAGAGALLVALASVFFLRPGGAESPPAPPASDAAADAQAAPPGPPPDAEAVRRTAGETLSRTTEAWARAWSEQRVDDYLGFYSRRFTPPRSLDRGGWEAQRRFRIEKPAFIQVGISGLETELLSRNRARVAFDQVYRSDSYRDATRKTLELVLEDGRWKILEERSGA